MKRAAVLLLLAFALLAHRASAQAPAAACPCPLTIAWDLDPAHDAPGLLWELEIDGVGSNPCGRVEVTPTERRCHGFITPGQHFLRLRGVNGATAGGWSAAIVHTFIAPGPWTITATFSNETVVGIATDNAVDGGFVAGSQTTAFTVGSGSNRKMIVGVDANGGDTVTEVTYDGVSMFANLIAKTQDGTGAYNYAFYLDNPSSGTHNIVVSVSGSRNISTAAVAYSGTAAGPPRVFATDRNPTTVAIILTPPTDGCWIVLFAANHGMPNMDGGDAIIHGYDTGKSYQFLGDTGPIAGTLPTTVSSGRGGTVGGIAVVIEPAAPSPNPTQR